MRLTLVCTQRGYTLADLGMQDGGSAVLNLRISPIRSRLDLRQYHRSFANLVDERGEHWAHIQREDKYNLPATSNMITVLHV